MATTVYIKITAAELQEADHTIRHHLLDHCGVIDNPLCYLTGDDLRGSIFAEIPDAEALITALNREAITARRDHADFICLGGSVFINRARRLEKLVRDLGELVEEHAAAITKTEVHH